ncbi:MAG TPA: RsmG family class I SAM-dependent methyltransferase [Acidimicrobiia bacterium]
MAEPVELDDPVLDEVLERARSLGFLGPGPVAGHVRHALAMARFAGPPVGPVLDLGSGGGIPGLVLARIWPVEVTLVDSMHRRTAFLVEALGRLDLAPRVRVVEGRAEALAREPELRGAFDLVVARGFGAPAVTAECGVGFLGSGGRLVVSEPPEGSGERWPAEGVARLGLEFVRAGGPAGASFVELCRTGELDATWPRRTGVPAKRPAW